MAASPAIFAQTPTPIPNDPACLNDNGKWLDIINARATIMRLFGATPPTPLVPEVTILFVGAPLKFHEDLTPNVRQDLEVNLNPNGGRPDDPHETTVASTAVARTHNAFGVCAVAGDGGVKAASAIVVDNNGFISGDAARDAIRYAINKKKAGENIEIIAMAFSGGDDPKLTRPLIEQARDNGIIIVTSAGTRTSPVDLDDREVYPARYAQEFDNVVVVTALDPDGTALDPTSNRGVRTVQVAAAGQVTVVSFLDPKNGGGGASGSSIGVGQVAGALGLIKRNKERNYRLAIDRLLFAASRQPVNGVGYGKLDVDGAFTCGMTADLPELVASTADPARLAALDGGTFTREPFTVANEHNLGVDKRTRLLLPVLGLKPGDSISNVSVTAVDSRGQTHLLSVEAVRRIPASGCLWQVNVVLPALIAPGDARLTMTVRGKTSGGKLVKIQ